MIYHGRLYEYSNALYHLMTFLKCIGDIFGSVFSPLISHIFLITCERPCQPVCEILLHLPLCLHTSTHTQLIGFKETVPLKAAAPREVTEGKRRAAPPLAAQGVNAVDYNEASLLDLLLPLLPSAPPHAHLISLPPPFLTRSPPFSFLPPQWGKVFSAPTVQALIRLSAARACRRSRRSREQGSLEENSSIST